MVRNYHHSDCSFFSSGAVFFAAATQVASFAILAFALMLVLETGSSAFADDAKATEKSASAEKTAGEKAASDEKGASQEKPAADSPKAGHDAHAPGGHGDHGDGHSDDGVPGLVPNVDLALWSLIVFALLLFVVQKAGWQSISAGLNERERKIRQDIADAESSRVKSQALLAEHEQRLAGVEETVKGILAEARRDAEHTKAEIVAVAQKEAESTRQRAIADIERSRDQALVELFDYVSRGVLGATEKVISKSLTSDEQQRLVMDALGEMNLKQG